MPIWIHGIHVMVTVAPGELLSPGFVVLPLYPTGSSLWKFTVLAEDVQIKETVRVMAPLV
jgi:hypothetical protein